MFSSLRYIRLLLLFLLVLTPVAMLHAQSFPIYGAKSGWKNTDGSSRIALEFSGGGTPTAGASRKSQTRGWTYRMGGGYNFNRRFALLAEYTYNHFDVPQPLVTRSMIYLA